MLWFDDQGLNNNILWLINWKFIKHCLHMLGSNRWQWRNICKLAVIDFVYVNSTILAKWMAEVILSKITFILMIWFASFEVKDALKGVLLLPLHSALTLILLLLYSFQFISLVFLYYFLKIIYFICFATEVSFWQVAFWRVLTEDSLM